MKVNIHGSYEISLAGWKSFLRELYPELARRDTKNDGPAGKSMDPGCEYSGG